MTDVREKLNQQKVLVTGASGFIGRRLVKALADAGAEVTALSRTGFGAADLGSGSVKTVTGSLNKPADLPEILRGQNVVFHLAYDVRASAAENLSAFENLYNAAIKSGVGRFVHTSSIVVYDGWPDRDLDEKSPMDRPGGSPYRRAKIDMERQLMNGPLPAAILQPTIVYGPGSALWTLAPQAALRQGPVVLPDPVGTCAAVHVEDVISAALLAATLPDLGRERFIVSGPDTPSWADFYNGHAQLIKTGSVTLVPLDTLASRFPEEQAPDENSGPSLAARISAALRQVIGSRRFDQVMTHIRSRRSPRGPVYPDRHQLALYAANPRISPDHARARLGYNPRFDLKTGLSTTAD